MKFSRVTLLLWALVAAKIAFAAPAPPPGIPAPVEKIDADALALFERSARAHAAAQALDFTFFFTDSDRNESQTVRLRLRRPGDAHWQSTESGETLSLSTDDRAWLKNQAGFYWHSGQHYGKSNLELSAYAPQTWLGLLLAGKNPLREVPQNLIPLEQQWSQITLLAPQTVRGQACVGAQRRVWFYEAHGLEDKENWRFMDYQLWLRADDLLLWEVHGETKIVPAQEGGDVPVRLEVTRAQLNPQLAADAFEYRLSAKAHDWTRDEATPFWSDALKIGALPPPLENNFDHTTLDLADFKGRPVVVWFGFPDDATGALPAAQQLAKSWTPYGVQIVAVQMETTQRHPNFSFPVVMAANDFNNSIAQKFGLQKAPFILVLARDGSIAALNPSDETLETTLFELLKAPDPASPAARDAATGALALQLLDDARRGATLELWENRALPRPFLPAETAPLLALLPRLEPFEAGQLARVLARSHDQTPEPRVAAIVGRFMASVRGPVPDDDPKFARDLSPRAQVLSGFLDALANFNAPERAAALRELDKYAADDAIAPEAPDVLTWLTLARARCGDETARARLHVLLASETDVSNAIVIVRVLARTAGVEALAMVEALQESSARRFDQIGDYKASENLRAAIGEELERLKKENP